MCNLRTVSTVVEFFFFFKQKTAYEMRISDWSSDVCSSDLFELERARPRRHCDVDRPRHHAVRVNMPRMRAAGFEHIDPQAIELEPLAAEVERAEIGRAHV